MKQFVEKAKDIKIVIDHHPQPKDFPDFLFSDIKASATCELVFDFIQSMGDQANINKEIAECLYTGILTDTGGFQFPITTPKVHRITADRLFLPIGDKMRSLSCQNTAQETTCNSPFALLCIYLPQDQYIPACNTS